MSFPTLENIYGREDGGTHGGRIGHIPSRQFESRSMVRGSTHYRKARRVVHSVGEGDSLERRKTLVMVHCKGCIEILIVAKTEISVRRERAKGLDAFLVGASDSRNNHSLLLIAQKASVSAVRIQAKHPYSRIVYAEIALQRSLHQTQFGKDFLFCNLGRHILERNMPGDYSELDTVRNHQHGHILHTETALQELGVTRELESLS